MTVHEYLSELMFNVLVEKQYKTWDEKQVEAEAVATFLRPISYLARFPETEPVTD